MLKVTDVHKAFGKNKILNGKNKNIYKEPKEKTSPAAVSQ